MDAHSPAPSAPTAPLPDWQAYLDQFTHEASAKGFIAYLNKIKAHGRTKETSLDINLFGPLQIIDLILSLSRAALLACLQLQPSEVPAALARINIAANAAHYGRTLQNNATAEENRIYQRVRKFIPEQLRKFSQMLQPMFLCYAQGDYDATRDADEIMREARDLAETGEHAATLTRIGQAGAVALRSHITWQGWATEGGKGFQDWAFALRQILESVQHILPLADVDTERQRADEIVTAFATRKAEATTKQREPRQPAEPEETLELVKLAARKQPLSDDEIHQMGATYERYLDFSKTMFDSRYRPEQLDPHDVDFAHAKGFAVLLAIRALGVLRCQDEAIAEQLIDVIAADCADDDSFDDSPMLKSATRTLGQMGPIAAPACFAFLRYSSQHQARFWVARALGVAGRGNEDAFQTLLTLSEQTELDNGKVSHLAALAKLHDDRAIPLVADVLQALSGPNPLTLSDSYEDDFVLEEDQFELLDALHELNAIEALDPEPNPDRYLDENDDGPGAVIVRGYGRIAQAVPANWDYPDRRLDEDEDEDDEYEDDDEYEEDDEMESALHELVQPDPPFLFTPSPKLQPIVNANKTGRNDPCPCGSGKKYKHCHGKDG